MFNSIKWRFTIIYFILIFIALITAGIFIVQAFEEYHLSSVEKKIDDLSNIILPRIENLEKYNPEDIQKIILNYKELGFEEEIYVVNNDDRVIATSTEKNNEVASSFLGINFLISAKNGNSKIGIADIKNSEIRTMDKAMPIYINNKFRGILFIRYNLNNIYMTLSKTTMIIVKAILMTTAITVVICFLIAKTISEPIEDIAKKALLLGDGDFGNKVEVKSDDEIGDLASIFNVLTDKLQYNINEVYKEKNKMETIVEYMNDGLIAMDLEGNIIHINSRAESLLNIKNQRDKIGYINNILGIENIISNNELIGITNFQVEESILKIDYLPFEDDQQNQIGLVFVIRDITEREKLDSMRKEFVANVSHELKTPLTSIRSYSETLINDDYDDDITKKFLNVINSEANRMGRLVRDLLKLSNFDSSFAKGQIENNNWVTLIESIILKLKPSYKAKDQYIDFNVNVENPIGQFDYDRMEQVVINILSNSIKYTPENGKININLMENKDEFIISIEDNGIGIPEDDLKHIFDRFYRVNKARSRKLGGTGLGLSIAKEIVKMHNGDLKITSLLDNGTTATLAIPK